MREFHLWLKKKQEKGEPVPKNREELNMMYKIERPKFLYPRNYKQPSGNNKWMRESMKSRMAKYHWQ